MQYDERHTTLAKRDIRNYWKWLSDINAKSDDCRYRLFEDCDPFALCDCIQRKIDTEGDYTECNVELKGRDILINAYDDCVVDQRKVNQLQHLAIQSGKPTFIVALYYPSGQLAIWEVDTERQYTTVIKNTPIHTAAPEVGRDDKLMVSLPLAEARVYTFTPIA